MSEQRLELILGIILIITPSTGFPLSFKFFIVFAIGVAIVIISLLDAIKRRVGDFHHKKISIARESEPVQSDRQGLNSISDPRFQSEQFTTQEEGEASK